jgi:multidrug efflux pump subunit AcrB
MDIAKIKNSKEYRLTKLEVLHLYFETKQMNEILLKQLADANAGKKPEPEPEPQHNDIADILYEDQVANEDKLNVILEPAEPEPEGSEKKLEVLNYLYNNKTEDLKEAKQELKEAKEEIKNLQNVISKNGATKLKLDLDIFRNEVFKLGIFNKEDDTQIDFTLDDLVEQLKEREIVYEKYWQDMECMEERQEAWDKLSKIEEIHNAFHNLISTKF